MSWAKGANEMAKYHPNKEISAAIDLAIQLGWTVVYGSGHVFATLRCPRLMPSHH